MDRAGRAVAGAAVAMGASYGSRVSFWSVPGNNGGDGLCGRQVPASPGYRGSGPRLRGAQDAASQRRTAPSPGGGGEVRRGRSDRRGRPVIDAFFGGGFRQGLAREVKPWLEHPAPVLAVDVPSGLDPGTGQVVDESFIARRTLTFHALKTGHLLGEGPDRCGEIEVADIGLLGGAAPIFLSGSGGFPLATTSPHGSQVVDRVRAGRWWRPGNAGCRRSGSTAALHFGAGAVGLAVPGRIVSGGGRGSPRTPAIPDHVVTGTIPGPAYRARVWATTHGNLAHRLLAEWERPGGG